MKLLISLCLLPLCLMAGPIYVPSTNGTAINPQFLSTVAITNGGTLKFYTTGGSVVDLNANGTSFVITPSGAVTGMFLDGSLLLSGAATLSTLSGGGTRTIGVDNNGLVIATVGSGTPFTNSVIAYTDARRTNYFAIGPQGSFQSNNNGSITLSAPAGNASQFPFSVSLTNRLTGGSNLLSDAFITLSGAVTGSGFNTFTNIYGSGAVLDFSGPQEVTTNLAGNATFTSVSGVSGGIYNYKVIHFLPNGSDRTTIAPPNFNPQQTVTITNGRPVDGVYMIQPGVVSNVTYIYH